MSWLAISAVLMVLVFATILSIQPDHHNPPCGGSNIVVALFGPQGAARNQRNTGACRPLAIADVVGATALLAVPPTAFVIVRRGARRLADGAART